MGSTRGTLWLLVLLLSLPAAAAAVQDCSDPGADCVLREVAAQAGVLIGAAAQPGFITGDPNYGPVVA